MNFSPAAARAGLAAGAALVLATAGISTAVAATGHQAATTHTMHIVSTQLKDVIVNGVDVATDRNAWKGQTTGYDVTSCTISTTTHVATCKVAVARAQGILYARAHVNVDNGQGSGTVTGGSGGFRGATGTVTVGPGPTQNSTKITISYQN